MTTEIDLQREQNLSIKHIPNQGHDVVMLVSHMQYHSLMLISLMLISVNCWQSCPVLGITFPVIE